MWTRRYFSVKIESQLNIGKLDNYPVERLALNPSGKGVTALAGGSLPARVRNQFGRVENYE